MQLNDAHVRLGAEDGLAFGSVHATGALELVAWLQKVRFDGHIYWDTFPRWVGRTHAHVSTGWWQA